MMDNIKDYDDDGFELKFEDDTPDEERKYYVKAYTNVNLVADRRIHCTCCDMHIGTAPSAEKLIKMHPVLRVTQCMKCNRFYNSGGFDKGEDGSELYCRWCGQGGEVYCCSNCPYVFCKKCILTNLTRVALHDVTKNDNWKCFSCAPKIMYHLRAQHWALVNFIAKQKLQIEKIVQKGLRSQDEIADAMNRDVSRCCKVKSKTSDGKKKKRNVAESDLESDDESSSDDWGTKQPKLKKKKINSVTTDVKPTALPKLGSEIQIKKLSTKSTEKVAPSTVNKTAKQKKNSTEEATENTSSTEVECTPDLFDFLVNRSFEHTVEQNEDQTAKSVMAATAQQSQLKQSLLRSAPKEAANPTPLRIQTAVGGQSTKPGPRPPLPQISTALSIPSSQRIVRRVNRPQDVENSPVYHMYNGYRIDLNTAAQQSTLRLPNGKIIHVRKQPTISGNRMPPPHIIQNQLNNQAPAMRPTPMPMRQLRPNQQQTCGPPPLIMTTQHSQSPYSTFTSMSIPMPDPPGTLTMSFNQNQHTRQGNAHLMQQRRQLQQVPQQHFINQSQIPPQQFINQSQQLPNPNQPRLYSNDPVGRARTQLEKQIFSAAEICHQIDGKLKTLMNSNAYKNVHKLNDIKELYIHLSYLFTYTNGRFHQLQNKCMEDLRRLGFKSDANSLISGNVIDKYGSDCDEDEIEIVEPIHTTINLDDSDDEQASKQIPTGGTSALPEKSNEPNDTDGDFAIRSSSTENLECDVDIAMLLAPQIIMNDGSECDELVKPDSPGIVTPPIHHENDLDTTVLNDIKLKKTPMVILKPAELEYPHIIEKLKNLSSDQLIEYHSSDEIDTNESDCMDVCNIETQNIGEEQPPLMEKSSELETETVPSFGNGGASESSPHEDNDDVPELDSVCNSNEATGNENDGGSAIVDVMPGDNDESPAERSETSRNNLDSCNSIEADANAEPNVAEQFHGLSEVEKPTEQSDNPESIILGEKSTAGFGDNENEKSSTEAHDDNHDNEEMIKETDIDSPETNNVEQGDNETEMIVTEATEDAHQNEQNESAEAIDDQISSNTSGAGHNNDDLENISSPDMFEDAVNESENESCVTMNDIQDIPGNNSSNNISIE